MADVQLYGFIEGIRFTENGVIVTVSERRLGYKKKDGTIVDEDVLLWHVVFKAYFKKYISSHFSSGMLVKIKGMILPYSKEHDEIVEGYSFIGQTIDLSPYPKNTLRRDMKIIKESELNTTERPNIDEFMKDDF